MPPVCRSLVSAAADVSSKMQCPKLMQIVYDVCRPGICTRIVNAVSYRSLRGLIYVDAAIPEIDHDTLNPSSISAVMVEV